MLYRIFVSLLVLSPVSAAAQEVLTLDGAVKAALAQNAALRASRAATDEASARASEAHAGFFPRISFTESWQRGDEPVFVFSSLLSSRRFTASNFAIDSLNHPEPTGFFHASVGIEQLLFDGGGRRAASTAAGLRRNIAGFATDEAAGALAVATTQTYGRVVFAQADRRAAEAGLNAAREDLARAERRRDAGLATDADVLELVVHVADLQQRAIKSEGDAAAARAELNRLIGNPVVTEIQVVEPLSAPLDRFTEHPDMTALMAEADAARPELKRAMASAQLAEEAQRQARSGLIPHVAAQAAVGLNGTTFTDRASSWLFGGELRWTFSTGGAEMAATKAAAASMARAKAEADDARATVHVDVVSALRRLEAARARVDAGHAAVNQARESQRIIRDRFDAGIAPVNDVLRASRAVLDAETNRVGAVVDSAVATAQLRRALGRTP
jgi:outer membrane protein TolC